MNDKFGAAMAVTNGELGENGEIKNSASGDDCSVGDSHKVCLGSSGDFKSNNIVPDSKSDLDLNSGVSCHYPALKGSVSVSNIDNLSADMISKQVDPCEPDSKHLDSLVEDSADTLIENEVEDDFKLALSPEASGADNLSEQNEEDSTKQLTKSLSYSNISEDMEANEHKEASKFSEETEGPNLGNKSPDIARLTDVILGSDIIDCAVGEGVIGGDSKMIVDDNCASDACVGYNPINEHGNYVPSLLKEGADPLQEKSEISEVTQELSTSAITSKECKSDTPSSKIPVTTSEDSEGATLSSNIEDCCESSTCLQTQGETEDSAVDANTVGCQESSSSCTAQVEEVKGAVQISSSEDCSETLKSFTCSVEKSTNFESVLDKGKIVGECVLDDKTNVGCVLDDAKNIADPVVDELVSNAEPVVDKFEINLEPVMDDFQSNSEPMEDVKSKAETVSDELKSNAETVSDDLISNAETVSDDLKSNAETVSDDLKSNAETVSDDLKHNAETVSDDFKRNAELLVDGECGNSLKNSSCKNKSMNDVLLENTLNVQSEPERLSSEINIGIVSRIVGSDNVSGSNVDSVASPSTKTSDNNIDTEIASLTEGIKERAASPSCKISDDSCKEETALPTKRTNSNDDEEFASPASKTSEDNIEEIKEEKELHVSPIKTTSVSNETCDSTPSMEVEDEDLLKSSKRKKSNDENIDLEEEAALLSSPDWKLTQSKLLEEETLEAEDDALLNSPEPKSKILNETDIEMKDDDLLKSPEIKTAEGLVNVTCLGEETIEDQSSSQKLVLPVAAIEDVLIPGEISKVDFKDGNNAAINSEEGAPAKLRDETVENNSPSCQETVPRNTSDASLKANAPAEELESMELVEPMEVVEPMELDDGPCKERIPAKEEKVDSKEEKPELKLEQNGTSDSDQSDSKSTDFSHISRKDQEGSASMTLSRKRAHSPVTVSEELDEKLKCARTVNGFDEKSPKEDASPRKEDDVSSAKRKFEISPDSVVLPDETVSKITKEKSEVKEDVPEITSKCETDMKSKSESEEALLDPVDLSYLRKLHKGRVEKLSRNDLEELLVQKLCEAITERSEVGDMRLRCQALERGQEKWKEKYTQLQKQVRELNIVIKKFLSEQASAAKDKNTPPTPVRITRSVGLQVALPGSSQRSLAGMRIRAQREAAAAAASAAVSAASTAAAASSGSPNSNKSANINSSNVNTAQMSTPVRTPAVSQSPARRLQETPSKITSPTIQQLPHRQVNSSVSSTTSIPTVNATPPRVSAAPQPCLTLTRPLTSPQVPPQIQTTQLGGNNRARSVSGTTLAMRNHTQTHIVHQVQQRQQPLQAAQHSSVSQVVMSTSSTPQIGRLQVVLAPQQQQQLLQQQQQQQQQQHQQIVLRQSQPPSKDVEIIDLDKDDRSRQPTRTTVQQIQQVTTSPSFPPNGNMTVRLVSNQQSGVPLTSQSHMTLLVPATAQQQKMIITSAPSTVQLNSNQGKSRTNQNVVLKGVVQAMQAQGNAARQQGVVQQGTIIPSRGLTIVQQAQQAQQQMPQLQQLQQLQQLRPIRQMGHPAPLPVPPAVQPDNPGWKMPPPKPSLKIQHTDNGIVLSWNMNLYSSHEDIDTYQLYAYQEGNSPPSSSLWKKVGDVKALPLPMACTLTQFAEGHRYHFAVRAVDVRSRIGPFSAPGNIRLEQKAQ